jgi:hypothetical protein
VWVRDLVVGDIERAHRIPPIVSAPNVAHSASIFQTMISGHANMRCACRANAALFPNDTRHRDR